MSDLPNVCNLITGIILIQSVRNIRKFYAKHGEESMDFAAMFRHASCFVLFLVANIVLMLIYNISVFAPQFNFLFQWSTIFYYSIEFTSNMMLAYIFYDVFRDQKQA